MREGQLYAHGGRYFSLLQTGLFLRSAPVVMYGNIVIS
jgi:hypothetical protein